MWGDGVFSRYFFEYSTNPDEISNTDPSINIPNPNDRFFFITIVVYEFKSQMFMFFSKIHKIERKGSEKEHL